MVNTTTESKGHPMMFTCDVEDDVLVAVTGIHPLSYDAL